MRKITNTTDLFGYALISDWNELMFCLICITDTSPFQVEQFQVTHIQQPSIRDNQNLENQSAFQTQLGCLMTLQHQSKESFVCFSSNSFVFCN
jgi:hypothetical protein